MGLPITLDKKDNIYLADNDRCRILSYKTDGEYIASIELNKKVAGVIDHMFIDNDDNIIINNYVSAQKYKKNGEIVKVKFFKFPNPEYVDKEEKDIKSVILSEKGEGVIADENDNSGEMLPLGMCQKITSELDDMPAGIQSFSGKNKLIHIQSVGNPMSRKSDSQDIKESEGDIIITDLNKHILSTINIQTKTCYFFEPITEDKYENFYLHIYTRGDQGDGIHGYKKEWIYKFDKLGKMLSMIEFLGDAPIVTGDGRIFQVFNNLVSKSVDVMKWERLK